jgi:soluble cytochrome b562
MREDDDEAAEERRRRARAEIMEKSRIIEEMRRKKRTSKRDTSSPKGSFDTLVDKDQILKTAEKGNATYATTTAVEPEPAMMEEYFSNRRSSPPHSTSRALHASVDKPIFLRQLSSQPDTQPEDPS